VQGTGNPEQENERAEKGQRMAKNVIHLNLCVNLPEGERLPWPMKRFYVCSLHRKLLNWP